MDAQLFQAIFGALIALASLATTGAKSFRFVHESEKGVILRFGKVLRKKGEPIIVPPGFRMIIPFVDNLPSRHVKQQTISFNPQSIMLRDNSVFIVNAMLLFRVIDVYKTMFEIDDVDQDLKSLVEGIIRDVVSAQEDVSGLHDLGALSEEIMEKAEEATKEWGIEFLHLKLTDCSPTAATADFIQAKTAIQAKKKALEDAGISIESPVAAAFVGAQVVTVA